MDSQDMWHGKLTGNPILSGTKMISFDDIYNLQYVLGLSHSILGKAW